MVNFLRNSIFSHEGNPVSPIIFRKIARIYNLRIKVGNKILIPNTLLENILHKEIRPSILAGPSFFFSIVFYQLRVMELTGSLYVPCFV